ncbi:ComF family protein [Streptomyces sp. NRRL S-1868]|uniref:ComF family protein n=1 Tax=Streptomyces sp. NRRL S-1868 TaxID=1463892 RepID=UPI00055C6B5B|nr:ComF family protein [Streptomyces sp. NRRL S-1868]
MRESWKGLRQEIAGLVLPVACAGCGRAGGVRDRLCGACGALLGSAVPWRVTPPTGRSVLPRVYAALTYTGEVRAALLAHKERGALGLAGPLGAALARAVVAALPQAGSGRAHDEECGLRPRITLVPVPSARTAVVARGHDPVRRMALAASRRLRRQGMPARVAPLLRQRRPVADQAGLTAAQRRANLDGALELAPGAGVLLGTEDGAGETRGMGETRETRGAGRGGEVVLVDDVMTTGASLAEAARALGGVRAAAVLAVRCGV